MSRSDRKLQYLKLIVLNVIGGTYSVSITILSCTIGLRKPIILTIIKEELDRVNT